jgi:chromatin remodeling complex protein RSC6
VGDKESIIHIFLYLDYKPQRYRVAPPLANLLKLHDNYTKTHIILCLWHYIRVSECCECCRCRCCYDWCTYWYFIREWWIEQQHKLQSSQKRSTVIADEALKQIFGVSQFDYMDVPKLLQPLLGPPEPIQLSYHIKY